MFKEYNSIQTTGITLLPKLSEFYDNCLAPEIVSPVHALGLPIRNLKNVS